MACIAICRPAWSAASTTGSRAARSQISSPGSPLAYGANMPAVHPSMVPSTMSLMPAMRTRLLPWRGKRGGVSHLGQLAGGPAGAGDEPVTHDGERQLASLFGTHQRRQAAALQAHVDRAGGAGATIGMQCCL